MGHIELPVPVYNVIFMDHMLRLLRSQCAYCGRLKLHRAEVNRFACKLKLIQYGLLQESEDLEIIDLRSNSSDPAAMIGSAAQKDEESVESEEEDEEGLIRRRDAFVKHAIRKNVKGKNLAPWIGSQKIKALAEQRRAVVNEFLSAASLTRVCGSCKG